MKNRKRNRRLLAKALILSLCITMLPIDALSMTVSAETEETGTAVVPGTGTGKTGTEETGTEETGTAVVPGAGAGETGTTAVSGAGNEGSADPFFDKGAEESTVTTNKGDAEANVVNNTGGIVNLTVTDGGGNEQSDGAGTEQPEGGETKQQDDAGTKQLKDGETKDSEGEGTEDSDGGETKNPNGDKGDEDDLANPKGAEGGEGGSSNPNGAEGGEGGSSNPKGAKGSEGGTENPSGDAGNAGDDAGNAGGTVEPDFEWEGQGTEQSPYLIQSEAELLGLAKSVNAGNSYMDKYFQLTRDLDLSSVCGADADGDLVNWEPIGYAADITFYGIFDGNDNSISNLYIEAGTSDYQGLFGTVSGTVKNLNVSGTVNGGSHVGGIAGYVIGTITHSEFSGEVQGTDYVGGIAGVLAPEGTLDYLTSDADVFGKGTCVGGIVGWANGIPGAKSIWDTLDGGFVDYGKEWSYDEDIAECTFEGTVSYLGDSHADTIFNVGKGTLSLEHRNDSYGGIAGACTGRAICHCYNEGTVTGDVMTGGIAGYVAYSTILSSGNSDNGTVTGVLLTGGAVGFLKNGELHTDTNNCGTVMGRDFTGGIAGYVDEDSISSDIGNFGTVQGIRYFTGGLFGMSECELNDLEASGAVLGAYYVGGIAGYSKNDVTNCVVNCNRELSLTGEQFVGGICGEQAGKMSDCVANDGTVEGVKNVGGMAGLCRGTIRNCVNNSTEVLGEAGVGENVGGIVGHLLASAENCQNNNGQVGAGNYLGGIAGRSTGWLNNCVNNARIDGQMHIGGIVGMTEGSVFECKNFGTIGGHQAAGIASIVSGNVRNCINDGVVDGGGFYTYVAGIVSNAGGDVTGCVNEENGTVVGGSGIAYKVSGSVRDCINKAVLDAQCGIVWEVEGDVIDCLNMGDLISSQGGSGAGIAYCIKEGRSISGCVNQGNLSINGTDVAGIVALLYGDCYACVNYGNVENSGQNFTGGIVGECFRTATIKRCENYGVIESNNNYCGGIVGSFGLAQPDETALPPASLVEDCSNMGEISGYMCVGGIAGRCGYGGTIRNCSNDGLITNGSYAAGGIVGELEGTALSCTNNGDLTHVIEDAGGIAGISVGTIQDCVNNGSLSSEEVVYDAGGIVGAACGQVLDCTNYGVIDCINSQGLGGIVGYGNGLTLNNCVNEEASIIQGAQMVGGVIGISYRNDVQDCANYGMVICPQNSTNFKLKAKEQQQEEQQQQQQQEGIKRYIKPVVIRYGGETFITNDTRERISSMKGNGGIAGISWLGTIETCENYGEVDSHVTAGGIVGFAHETKVSECVNRTGGSVTSNVNAGGIMGEGWSIKQLEECVNYGTITAKSDLGGICGFCQGHIKKCNNHGTLIGDANQDSMGGIVGYVEDGSVTECYNNGDIGVSCNYEGYDSGGIAGLCMTSTISYCLNEGGVQGGTNVGGIVGSLQLESLVTECKNLGDVTSKRDDIACIGGIVGLCISNNKNGHMDGGSTISKCVNGAGTTVSARRFNVGGIVGQLHTGKVLDCYNLGIVHGEASVGGIAGIISGRQIELCRNYCMAPSEYPGGGYGVDKTDVNGLAGGVIGYTKTADVQIHDNYWWTSCSKRAYGWRVAPNIEGEVTGYDNLNQFTVATNFNNWDFNTVWTMVGQPVLRYETGMSGFFAEAAQEQDESISGDPYGLGGGGSVVIQGPTGGYGSSSARTVCIWSVEDLKDFRDAVNQGDDCENVVVVLCTDLDLTGENWSPIGTYNNNDYWDYNARRPFLGSFDGRGHSINGLYVDCGELPAGFFGYVGAGGKVSNLYVSGSVKSAGREIGGIVGRLDDGGRIENCVFDGPVTGCGGADCVNDEDVNNAPVVGGIVGRSLGYLYYCYHVGDVSTTYGFAGGVAGRLQGNGKRMNYCFQYGGNISGGRIGKTLYDLNTTTGGLIGMASSTYVNDSYCACTGTNRVFGYEASAANNSWNVDFVDAAWLKNVQNLTTNGKYWDISDEAGHVWGMGENYPVLQIFSEKVTLDPGTAPEETKTLWVSRSEGFTVPDCNASLGYGMRFGGWNTDPEGNGASYAVGAAAFGGSTLYAQWVNDTVTIWFRGDGGSGFMDPISAVKGETFTLPANEFTRIGYTFGGWWTRLDDEADKYGNQQSITADKNLCLYATWLPDSYTIGFATNGTNPEILYSEKIQAGKTPVYGGTAPTYVGAPAGEEDQWIFDGWSPVIDVVADAFTYQAKFVNKLQEYSINVQFGTADLATAMVGEQVQIMAGAPATGMVFDHWESDDVTVLNPANETTSFTMPRKDVFITAVYKNASYPVTLDAQGGTINDGNVTTYTYGEGASLPTDVTREHYTFEGWYTGRNGTGVKAEVIGLDEVGERTFYAYWKPVPYDVTVVAGNGMTLKAGSGAETQGNVTGEIAPVVYVAAEGYYFPDYYYTTSKDGLTVTRNSVSQITVSGRPTADVQLTLRDAIAKEQEDTPEAEFNATGTDSGTLSHLVVGAKYVVTFSVYDEVSGTWVAGTVSPMEFTAKGINQSITGLSEGLLGLVRKGGDTTLDSKKIQFTLYGNVVPDSVETIDCTENGSNDGRIVGVNEAMDYRQSGDTTWTAVTGSEITGLVPGTYELRMRPDGTQLASETKTVTIGVDGSQKVTVSFAANGGSGSMDDITVAVGEKLTLPKCGFTAPEGMRFDYWTVNGDKYRAGEEFTNFGSEDEICFTANWMEESDRLPVSIAHAISLENSMAISFLVSESSLTGYSDIRLVTEKKRYKNDGVEGYDIVRTELTPETASTYSGFVQFKYTGVGAKAMGDDIHAVLYATKDGKEYHTTLDGYSVKKYAYNTLRKTDTADSLKTLLVDMLNYGTAAQEYFKYNEKQKVNADLTDEERGRGTFTNPTLASCSKTTTAEGAHVTMYGKLLSLENSVEIKYVMNVPSGFDLSNARLVIEYEDAKLGKHGKTVQGSEFGTQGAYRTATFDIIATKDMGQVVTATLYENDEFVAFVDTYSIESYCRSKTKKDPTNDEEARLQAVCFALMKFNRSAAEYFNPSQG